MKAVLLSIIVSLPVAQANAADDAPTVHVQIDANSPAVELFRITSEGVGTVATGRGTATVGIVNFERQCRAPCDLTLSDPRHDFFISGDGITPSSRFTLMGAGEDVTLKVDAGNATVRSLGWIGTSVGVTAAVTGGTLLLLQALLSPSGSSLRSPSGAGNLLGTVGWASVAGGGALLGAGIPMIAFSGTEVEILPGSGSPRPGQKRSTGASPTRRSL